MDVLAAELASKTVSVRGRSFQVYNHPVVTAGAHAFASGLDDGTLRFFDAVLPRCYRMIDCGAGIGFNTLYAAGHGVEVRAFEPSRMNFQLLSANVEVNSALAHRIKLYSHGIGTRDERVALHATGDDHRRSSVFQNAGWGQTVAGRSEATVELRAGDEVLRYAGLDRRTLLKIDIEGDEYAVLPAIADLLSERKPWLHISFYPCNIAADRDPYGAAIHRLRAALQVAEATASYRYMHLFTEGNCCTIGPDDRLNFLRQHLLQPKTVPGIGSQQYGFVDAMAFSDEALPGQA